MNPKAELAELVNDHLSRNANVDTIALASVIRGLVQIMDAYNDAKSRRGNWGEMIANLEAGRGNIQAALPYLRQASGGVERVIEAAERELDFAASMIEDIERLRDGASTLA